ncbi:AT-rich interactive domain-containing protein 4A isoform X1 [Polypterus senegalus]|uniref:AT-rich interactive domain-containing protein 4A isoform X1 n=1 Tax=Polypterus senegalus TaxID=55291 RepID=UPI00196512DA|nr:AT-rich interactive domain-containing protein 4A isoform X1 [Polypterus senegalus]
MKAVDEPAYLTVGTDVSAKYRGAFCEAKIKSVKRHVKVKVFLRGDSSTQVVQDDQVKGPLRVGAAVEVKSPDGSCHEGVISKLTDASWYTVVFDDGDERTLRRTSLCLKGERHFAESETLDQLPLTNPEHFGTPVIAKKANRGRRSSLPVTEDDKEEESSEEEDEDKRRLHDDLLGKVACVQSSSDTTSSYLALVLSPSCSDDLAIKKDQCLVRSFADSKFYTVARKDILELDVESLLKPEYSSEKGLQETIKFLNTKVIPESWKMDMSEILESSSSEEEGGEGGASDEDDEKDEEEEEEEEEEPEEEPDPEEKDNFLQQLYKFMEDRGTPINKPPVLGYKDLNLFKLFRLVYHQGGCDNIDSGAVWKQIYMDLGIPILNSAASYNVKTAYRKYLYGFEEYCRSASIQFRTIHHNNPKPQVVIEKEVKEEKKEQVTDQAVASATEDEECEEEEKQEADEDEPVAQLEKTQEAEDEEVEEEDDDDEEDEEEDHDSGSDSESEIDQKEIHSPRVRSRRSMPVNNVSETKESPKLDKLREEDKADAEKEEMTAEKTEKESNETPPKRTPQLRQKAERRHRQQEDSEKESDEEDSEERANEREESEAKDEFEEEAEEDSDHCLMGTKVRVKYGRGKTQKIYEANIKSTEVDDGELLYLVHYYGWNVRYDEWVKADRIIWPVDKCGTKRKQRRKIKSKEECEKDEKKEEDKHNKTKRGRPPLKITPSNSSSRSASKRASSESRLSGKSPLLSESSAISNGFEETPRRRTRHTSGLFDSDKGSNDSGNSSEESDVEDTSENKAEENEKPDTPEETKELQKEDDMPRAAEECLINPPEQPENVKELPEKIPVKLEEEVKPEPDSSITLEDVKVAQDDLKKEAEKSPKNKGRRSRSKEQNTDGAKVCSSHITEVKSSVTEIPENLDLEKIPDTSKVSEPKMKDFDSDSEREELYTDDKKPVKRKVIEQQPPEKRLRIERPNEQQLETPEKSDEHGERCADLPEVDDEIKNEMPALSPEVECIPEHVSITSPIKITEDGLLKMEDDFMPEIGPEALVCHEVDLDDLDEKDKSPSEDVPNEKPFSPKVSADVTSLGHQGFSEPSPTVFSPEESRSSKSESDTTIEVDSVAGESQEGLCESESANGFEASTSSSICSISLQERESKERGQKRSSDCNSSSHAKKQKRNQKRASAASQNEKNGAGHSSDSEDLPASESFNKCTPAKHSNIAKAPKLTRSPAQVISPHSKDGDKEKHKEKTPAHSCPKTYKWTFQLIGAAELDNMTSADRITFLQDKLQEIRKYYMSLKSEVASIDRRRKRLKKKEREVSHTTASTSSGSSDTGMSPPSASPTQNTVVVECR